MLSKSVHIWTVLGVASLFDQFTSYRYSQMPHGIQHKTILKSF